MAIITFWSDGDRETGKTLSIAAISTQISMENTYKTLLFNTEYDDDTLERCFFEKKKQKKADFDLSNRTDLATGIAGLAKAVLSNKTSPEIIKNYTKTIFKNRLEILTEGKITLEDYEKQKRTHKEIAKIANKYYNLVFIDLTGSINESSTRELLEISDIVIVNLPQNLKKIDEFMDLKRQTHLFNSNKTIILLGKCDEESKYNAKNVGRYMAAKDVFPIPYNTQFLEAASEGKVADLFMRIRTKTFRDNNTIFVESVKEASERILEKLKEVQMGA